MVLTIHARDLNTSRDAVGALLDSLASNQDLLWPRDRWPAIRFDRPLQVGAVGGHGPLRYRVERYEPGRAIRFRLTGMRGVYGTHGFEIKDSAPGRVRLEHRLCMRVSGVALLSWPLMFRWLHDALVEDALDRAEATVTSQPLQERRWSLWVRFLRRIASRSESNGETSMINVLVTGGAGRLGSNVVKELTATGYRVRIMSRKPQPANLLSATEWAQADLETSQGIADAVTGIDVIVHAASSPFKHTRQIDVDGTRFMLEQARIAGVAHVIYISIVGVDRIPYSYYRAKLAAEELVKNSGIPWSLLRATQFHYLVDLFFQAVAKLPLVTLLPTDLRCQSIAESEVASRLCELVAAGPRGRLPDLGGPEVLTAGEMMDSWLKLRGLHRRVLPLHVPGTVAQGFRCGYNTCPDQPVRGRITWTEWVQSKYEVQ